MCRALEESLTFRDQMGWDEIGKGILGRWNVSIIYHLCVWLLCGVACERGVSSWSWVLYRSCIHSRHSAEMVFELSTPMVPLLMICCN